jgi:hypothetical protein
VQIKSVDPISYAVSDIDKVIGVWSRLLAIRTRTFKENGGTDVKGYPWEIRMAFASNALKNQEKLCTPLLKSE